MMSRFSKMHGLGNDFVVIDARQAPVAMTEARARAIADRHAGIGCDQLIVIGSPQAGDQADVSMLIFNSDGSEVEACGNATHCVPLFVGKDVLIRTRAGLLDAKSVDGGASVDMGAPRFDWDAIPLAYPMDTLTMSASWEDLPAPAAVNVGNPHVIFFVDDADAVPLGSIMELRAADAPDMQIGDASVAGTFDTFTHLRLDSLVRRVEQYGGGVAHQAPRPSGDNDRAHDPHHRIEPDPAHPQRQRARHHHAGQLNAHHMFNLPLIGVPHAHHAFLHCIGGIFAHIQPKLRGHQQSNAARLAQF